MKAQHPQSPPRLLLVEDNLDLAEIFSLSFRNGGFDVRVATSGKDALQLLEEAQFQILVLDLHLPNISGETILKHIRSEPKYEKMYIIISSADPILAQTFEDSVDFVIYKPIGYDALLELSSKLKAML